MCNYVDRTLRFPVISLIINKYCLTYHDPVCKWTQITSGKSFVSVPLNQPQLHCLQSLYRVLMWSWYSTWAELERTCLNMDQLGKMMWWLFDCPATLGFNGDNSEKARPKSFFVGSEELDPMLCATADGPEAPTRPSILLFSFDQQLITIEGIYLIIF